MSGFHRPTFQYDFVTASQQHLGNFHPAMYSHSHHRPASPHLHPRASTMSPQRFQRSQQAPGRLPTLPKFHPATYSSAESSNATSPSSDLSSPGAYSSHYTANAYLPPIPTAMSPRRQYSEAQRLSLQHQRDLLRSRGTRSPHTRSPRPASPHLQPLGSPGPVTPLELEEADSSDYLFAAPGSQQLNEQAKEQILDVYIQKETKSSGKRRRHHDELRGHSRGSSQKFEL